MMAWVVVVYTWFWYGLSVALAGGITLSQNVGSSVVPGINPLQSAVVI